MKLTAYPEYKDSDVPWLGEIPSHWGVKKLKFLLSEPLQYGANESAELTDTDFPRYIRITDIRTNGTLKEDTFRSIEPDIATNYLLSNNDILLARSGATVGKSFIYRSSWGICAFAGYLIKARIDKNLSADYIYQFMQSSSYWNWLKSIFIQATIQNVSAEKYAHLKLPIPPLNEQQTIVNFLDAKLAHIDGLISKEQQLLEKLAEQRTAIISHAVTKGLDPNAPMKDSGVEWLGQVPAGWEVKRLKFLISSIQTGSTPPSSSHEYYNQEDINWYSPADITGNTIDLTKSRKKISWQSINDGIVKLIAKESILIVGIGTIGKVGINKEICTTNQQINSIKVTRENNVRFIAYLLISQEKVMNMISSCSLLKIMNQETTKSLLLAVPDINQQNLIANYLDQETAKIDKMVSTTQDIISKLQEYRSALITQAVTGRIDVRHTANN